jgi:hypothetical protein
VAIRNPEDQRPRMSTSKTLTAPPAQRVTEWRIRRAIEGSAEEKKLQSEGWEPFAALPVVPSQVACGPVVIMYRARVAVGAPIT